MIVRLLNLRTTNDGSVKTALVDAKAGSTGGSETFDWVIVGEPHTTTETFAAGEDKTVSVVHSASGAGLVRVTAKSSGIDTTCSLDVDAAQDAC